MQTIKLKNAVYLRAGYSAVGPLEGKGPLGCYFDYVFKDDKLKEKTFEKAERKMLKTIFENAIDKAHLTIDDVEFMFGGDLLNQIVSSSYTARELKIPFVGVYSACATMCESLALASIFVDNGLAKNVVAGTCTHFSSAERQYRFPLELGNQRPPTAQWTITGGVATVVSNEKSKIKVCAVTFGTVMYYNGVIFGKNYADSGCMMYDKTERVFMGGSGAGCIASVLNSYVIKKLQTGDFKRVLLVATGALMSTTTSQQGDTIPGIAHAVELEFVG
ncbi:MAG: stage V sporulation protein AD [Clostridia bacterium]|nr:stage V sporulation protein AD [Clostridia bacterium]